jgi:hypothetical protein
MAAELRNLADLAQDDAAAARVFDAEEDAVINADFDDPPQRAAALVLAWKHGTLLADAFAKAAAAGAGAGLERPSELHRPLVVRKGAALVRDGKKWNIWQTSYSYAFNGGRPWLPDQLVAEVRARFAADAEAGSFDLRLPLRLKLFLELEKGFKVVGRRPQPAVFPRTRDLNGARHAAALHGSMSLKKAADGAVDWNALQVLVGKEDHYDSLENIVTSYGNRVSRVRVVVEEYRTSAGKGATEDMQVGPNSLVEIPLPEGTFLCGQACLAYAVAKPTIRKNFCDRRRQTGFNAALKMAQNLNIFGAMRLHDFDVFVARYPLFSVTVMGNKNETLYSTRMKEPYATPLYLLLHKGHYCFIPKILAFVKPSKGSNVKWCHNCKKSMPGGVYKRHACVGSCGNCRHYFTSDEDVAGHCVASDVVCAMCNFELKYAGCVPHHRCTRWRCTDCFNVYPMGRKEKHVCNERHCGPCDVYTPEKAEPHRCFVKSVGAGKPHANLWCYDIESTLDCVDGETVHHVGLIVAMRLYTREVVVFNGSGVCVDFIAWVNSLPQATLIAHNASGYDAYLLLQAFKEAGNAPSGIALEGQKVIFMKVGAVKFIDSMRHVAGSLERVAATFAPPGGAPLAKGFFPYYYYTRETAADPAGCSGFIDLPPPEAFERRSGGDFDAWYLKRKEEAALGAVYDINAEAVVYCRLDVELLCGAMERYRDAGLAGTGVDPLLSVTIASYAMKVYRFKFMPPDSIPVLNRSEYDFVRRGFAGGRTDARQLYRSWTPEQVARGNHGKYYDIVSLYPTVQKYDVLPTGRPEWADASLLTEAAAVAAWVRELEDGGRCGMVECDVTCPRALYHPVLLEKRAGRLVAALDVTRGVWTVAELALALDKGYTVPIVHKAVVCDGSRRLFAAYVDHFAEMKARHAKSGPSPNSGLYALAKMQLNSLWGKFGQKDPVEETVFCSTPAAWARLVGDLHAGRIADLDAVETTADYVMATKTLTSDENLHLRTTNLMLAAYVTSRARIRLYRALDLYGVDVIYHDTDSVIVEVFPGKPGLAVDGEEGLAVGGQLGEWTDETDGVPITEVVALGPKTHAERCAFDPTTDSVKCKGFSTGFTLPEYRKLALDFLEGLAGPPRAPLTLEQKQMRFVRKEGQIFTVDDYTKKLVVSLQKVNVVSASRTLPFGFVE